jgi:pimeloyl-ACP methyl ester carboxylesterase
MKSIYFININTTNGRNLDMKKKRKLIQYFAIGLIILLLIVFIDPFLVPVPQLTGVEDPKTLADPDSRFIEINGLQVHYKEFGSGEPVYILLHGFGASLFSWREVFQPLSEFGRVIAYDRPAFGLTQRPLPGDWTGVNPYSPEGNLDLLIGFMDELNINQAILVGNSAGGTIAVNAALQYPDRITALILVDPAIYTGGAPDWTRFLFRTPQLQHLGPWFVRSMLSNGRSLIEMAWHDPSKITPVIFEGYEKPLLIQNWDQALWELTIATTPLNLAERLQELDLPVLVITGDDDRIVPTQDSIRLAAELPDAKLVVVPHCGHVPQEECPIDFITAVTEYLRTLP